MPSLPPDIHPGSRSRLPPLRRESLDAAGREAYDRVHDPESRLHARADGPSAIWLRIPELSLHAREINWHLRHQTGIGARLRETLILATAREMTAQFEWAAHEPLARKAGLPDPLIETLRHRAPLDSLPPEDAIPISLVRTLIAEGHLPSDLYAQAHALYGERLLVEIVLLVTNYAMTAMLLHAFDQQLPSGVEPGLPPLPKTKEQL